ncbi:MAG: outer membrane beta-barrel protein [Bacteroidales bacterium]|nr:outer membrane beta-barrel protein [Bacteroidales bacterium]HOK99732.1 outer membrane beta-barrel protein [Bacteroidales bacterium]HPO66505.1 outer membrane beta-barrel protein [Bacteroidales bacterium]
MKKHTICFVLVLIAVSYQNIFAQPQTDIYVGAGYSNFSIKDYEKSVQWGNYYTKLPCYSFGSNISFPFIFSSLRIGSGVQFISLATQENMPDDFETSPYSPPYTGPRNWNIRFYAISVPAFLNYKFEKWLEFKAGIANNFYLNKPKEIYYWKTKKYTLSFNAQTTIVLKEKIYLAVEYSTDITSVGQLQLGNDLNRIFTYFESINLKVGYRFNNEKK